MRVMSQSKAPTETASAPVERAANQVPDEPAAGASPESAKPPARRARRRGRAAPDPAPNASKAETTVAQARQILERLVRSAGHGWRDIDRLIHKNRGFTAHLLSKREGMPLTELLEILDVIDVQYEDFFAVLFPRFGQMQGKKPIGAEMVDLLGEMKVPGVPSDPEPAQEERAREMWGQLDRITELIDRRVLGLMEKALGGSIDLPPRPLPGETPAQSSAPAPVPAPPGEAS